MVDFFPSGAYEQSLGSKCAFYCCFERAFKFRFSKQGQEASQGSIWSLRVHMNRVWAPNERFDAVLGPVKMCGYLHRLRPESLGCFLERWFVRKVMSQIESKTTVNPPRRELIKKYKYRWSPPPELI